MIKMSISYAEKHYMPGFLSSFLRLQTVAANDVTHEWMGCPTGGIGVGFGNARPESAWVNATPRSCP